jgi:hypothetical protein
MAAPNIFGWAQSVWLRRYLIWRGQCAGQTVAQHTPGQYEQRRPISHGGRYVEPAF